MSGGKCGTEALTEAGCEAGVTLQVGDTRDGWCGLLGLGGGERQVNDTRDVAGLSLSLAERRCEPKTLRMGTPVHGCVWRETARAETREK